MVGVYTRRLSGARVTAARYARAILSCGLVLALAAAAACASSGKKPPVGTLEPDKFLFERGTDALNKKKWLTAREFFRELNDSYPQSTYRADAKLGMGDTYLGEDTLEASVLAVQEFKEFLSYYPTHPRADYAQYRLGMAHFYKMHGPERDQSETKDAISELQTFVSRYPQSEYLADGRKHLREARDRLSDSDYRVGFFYFRQRWYPGALDRFMALLKNDPEYSNRDAVYYYVAQTMIKVGRPAEALPYLDKLEKEFEQSEYLARAKAQAEEIKAAMEKK